MSIRAHHKAIYDGFRKVENFIKMEPCTESNNLHGIFIEFSCPLNFIQIGSVDIQQFVGPGFLVKKRVRTSFVSFMFLRVLQNFQKILKILADRKIG